jgi:putative heme iron utilization protein
MARIQARIQNTRKARFKAALALAGMSQKEFLEQLPEDDRVTRQHFNAVLNSDRESGKLTSIIDAFIEKIEKAVARAA